MAITIRNGEVENIIREIGRETGEGPSSLIGRWAREARARREQEIEDRVQRRRRAIEAWLADLPKFTDEDRAEVQRIMDDMYDESGLPK
jgi:hypothetical protein